MILNNKFNTKKPILDQLAPFLSDEAFSIALSEYGLNKPGDEDKLMEEMMNSDKYIFTREPDGWDVEIK